MKIVFLYESICTLGGIQRCITILSNYLVKKGYEVSIICTNAKEPIDRDTYGLDENVKVILVKRNIILKIIMHVYRKIIITINNKTGYFKNNKKILSLCYPHSRYIKKIIEKNDFDIIISSGIYCNAVLGLLKNINIKKIGWQHSTFESYFKSKNKNYWNQDAIIREMFENLDRYIVLTNDDRDKIKKEFGVENLTIYNATSFKQEIKSNVKNKKFIAAGRLNKVKGFDRLIKNFNEFNKINKEWKLEIIGEGEEKDKLLNLISELNLNEYVSILPRTNKIEKKYIEASIYCMSSYAEGFGMVAVEALESGLPVITYDLPCMREILKNDGIIIPNENDKKYVEAMLELAQNEEKRKELSLRSIKRAKDFYIEKIGKEWEDLFNELKKC